MGHGFNVGRGAVLKGCTSVAAGVDGFHLRDGATAEDCQAFDSGRHGFWVEGQKPAVPKDLLEALIAEVRAGADEKAVVAKFGDRLKGYGADLAGWLAAGANIAQIIDLLNGGA